jgi:hypothetical protein
MSNHTIKRLAVVTGLAALLSGAALAHDITIKTIYCKSTEDWSGADNNELRIYVDGAATPLKLNTRLNDGQTWTLNKTYKYNKTIKIELWDLDSPDADDLLGTLSIGPATSAGTGVKQRFTRDDADYTITYDLKKTAAGLSPKMSALVALEKWRTNGVAGKFTKIDKAKMIQEISTRIDLPWKMDQKKQSLCGPMTILMALALKDPERYVHMAKTMYETGKYTSRGKTIKPGAHLYTAAVPSDTANVDWMLAASMRDSENAIFDYDDGDKFAGITSPGEMQGWMETVLGCTKADNNSTYSWGEKKELSVAWEAVKTGNVAALFVDHSYMPGQPAGSINVPSHWVLLFDVQSIGDRVKFRVLSWGKVYQIDVNTDRFEDLMWGAIVGYGPGSKY